MTQPLRLGIAGLGTVGAAVVGMVARRAEALSASGRTVAVTAVSAATKSRDRGLDLSGFTWFDDPVALAQSDAIDVFVELVGGAEGPAKAAVEAAIASGKHVVTANKALLARHGAALAKAAEEKGVALAYEASVAGGIPVIKAIREGLAGNAVSRVYGILNGTCNYILSRMEAEGLTFEACLKDAQALGYAEADPTFDVEGFDTAHKLAILTSLAFGVEIDADGVSVEGISAIQPLDLAMADELGYRIKLLGVAQATEAGIEQRVHPTMVAKASAIAQVMGVTNAVTVDADAVGELTLIGPGAGGKATASAVVADIADVAAGVRRPTFGRPVAALSARAGSRCSATRAATTSADRPRPHRRRGRCRHPHGGSRHLDREHRPAPLGQGGVERSEGPLGPAGAAGADHLRGDRRERARGARCHRPRRPPGGSAPTHPHRARIAGTPPAEGPGIIVPGFSARPACGMNSRAWHVLEHRPERWGPAFGRSRCGTWDLQHRPERRGPAFGKGRCGTRNRRIVSDRDDSPGTDGKSDVPGRGTQGRCRWPIPESSATPPRGV